jgi:hypothetical protein
MDTYNTLAPLATTIAAPDQAALAEHVAAIRTLGKQTAQNVIEIGRRLTECRAILKKTGRWQSWLEDEFGWSDQQARRFIHVFERKSELNKLLTASLPVTSEASRVEIAQRAEMGETTDVAAVESAVAAHREPARKGRSKELPAAEAPTEAAAAGRAGIGPASSGELARKLARLEELEREVHRLGRLKLALESEVEELRAEVARSRGENTALRSEVRELKARLKSENELRNAPARDGGEDIPDFLRRAS